MGIRLLYAKITGYIGIAGLPSIEIDFTKCKNNVIAISGVNGVGKSRLLNAITSILPDNSDCFIPTMEASKIFQLSDGISVYDIMILHPLGSNNKRGTSKAYIKKDNIELNSNGNITSYKDIVFSEFGLDYGFLSLSRLSGDDRGLVDKRPAERRKFVSSKLDSLDIYNEMYKTLNKKCSIFRSYVNNFSTKIQNIGDENYLQTTIVSINSRLMSLQTQMEECKKNYNKCDALLSINNIDDNLKNRYNELSNTIDNINNALKNKNNQRDKFYNTVIVKEYGDVTDTNQSISTINNDIEYYNSLLSEKTVMSRELLGKITILQDNISNINLKLEKKKLEINPEITQAIKNYEFEMKGIEEQFRKIGIYDISNILPEEIDYLFTTVDQVLTGIDCFYDNIDSDNLSILQDLDFDDIKINSILKDMNNKINAIKVEKQQMNETMIDMRIDLKIINTLEMRPTECNINSCSFISEALSLIETKYKSKENFESEFNSIEQKINELNNIENELMNNIKKYESVLSKCKIILSVIQIINTNHRILSKFSIVNKILDRSIFLSMIINGSKFNFLRDLHIYNNISNSIIEYNSKKDILNNLQTQEKIQLNISNLVEEYENELKDKTAELDNTTMEYDKSVKDIGFTNSIIIEMNKKKERFVRLKDMDLEIIEINEEINKYRKEFEKLRVIFQSCSDTIEEMSRLKQSMNNLQLEISPLEEQKRQIEAQLLMLDNYKKDYQLYKDKYDLVEKLQKYSSPGKEGIQELFLDLFMSKTLDLSNQLLSMIFNGKYKLLPYSIKDGEFRMPFLSNGFIVDDVSSGSRSQKCMMGMIISLVMRNQSSTKFNITSLDEIDSGLDHDNRYLFVDVLYKIISILNIEQLFIVSHSIELSTSNVDVILLSNEPEYLEMFSSANIIYKNI